MRAKSAVLVLVLISLGTVAVSGTATAQTAETIECDFPYETTGLYGNTTIEEEPESIVTGAPSVTQTIWEMDAQDKVVGVSDTPFIQYLDGVNDYTDVGTAFDGAQFAEKVATAEDFDQPDLLIGALFVQDLDKNLDPFGFKYHWFGSSGDLEGIQETVAEIGRLTGECRAAEDVIEEMQAEIEEVEQSVEGNERPSVLYDIPTEGFGFVPGNGTFIDNIITTAGGKNMYAENGVQGFPQIDDEKAVDIVSKDPDWIVLPGGSKDDVPETDLYNSTTAVQENQILVVNANLIQQEGPRVTTPLRRMARAFHPDGFSQGEPEERESLGGGGQGIPERMRGEVDEQGTSESGNAGEAVTGARSVFENRTSFEFSTGPVNAVEFDSVVEGDVTVTPLDVDDAPATPLQRFRVDVPDAARGSSATLRTTVSSSAFSSAGAPAEDLVVARQEGDGWSALETTALETDAGATLVTETPGFSEFVVVASVSPTAVANVSEADEDTLTLDATASTDEYGEILSYEWTVDGESYEGETVGVSVPEGETEATLTVTNDVGLENTTTVTLSSEGETSDDAGGEMQDDTEDTSTLDSEEGATEGMPGFTAVATLVSLLAFAVVARRRR